MRKGGTARCIRQLFVWLTLLSCLIVFWLIPKRIRYQQLWRRVHTCEIEIRQLKESVELLKK